MERMINHDELMTIKVLKLIKAESDKFIETNVRGYEMKKEITATSIKITVFGNVEEHEIELTEKFLLEALQAIKEKIEGAA